MNAQTFDERLSEALVNLSSRCYNYGSIHSTNPANVDNAVAEAKAALRALINEGMLEVIGGDVNNAPCPDTPTKVYASNIRNELRAIQRTRLNQTFGIESTQGDKS
jgi:hypothetical protein